MPAYNNDQLYQSLVELAVIAKPQLDEAYQESQAQNIPFDEVLLKKDLISDENLGQVMADILRVPFVRLSEESIKPEILNIVPEIFARKHLIIIYDKDQKGLKAACHNPANTEPLQFLAKKTGDRIEIAYATQRDIEQALGFYQKDMQKSFQDLIADKLDLTNQTKDKELPISEIVDLFFNYAYNNHASDIHIEPLEEESVVRFRIDGVLHDVLHFESALHEQIVSRIKVLSKLRTDEHLAAQDGRLRINLTEEVDIRVSIVPIINGEKVVMRLLTSRYQQYGLGDLGFDENSFKKVKAGFEAPYGMVLSTGPTGSGKTTTIYAILKVLNTRDRNITTIEDPIEYEIDGINQIQVNSKTNLSFAEGLRSILRQDPNIIFVGEIRDRETAKISVNAALTGHLVLSTLHTNNAATTLPRLLDMGIEPFLVASTVNVIIAQRLVRKICEQCRSSVTLKIEDLSSQVPIALIKKYLSDNNTVRVYKGKGCPICHQTGYVGRIAIFEVLKMTDPIRELIITRGSADQIQDLAIIEGMTSMFEDGLRKVQQGLTTIEEVLRATKE